MTRSAVLFSLALACAAAHADSANGQGNGQANGNGCGTGNTSQTAGCPAAGGNGVGIGIGRGGSATGGSATGGQGGSSIAAGGQGGSANAAGGQGGSAVSGGSTSSATSTQTVASSQAVTSSPSAMVNVELGGQRETAATVKMAPDVMIGGPASGPCTGTSGGAGASGLWGGFGFNAATVDPACTLRENIRVLAMVLPAMTGPDAAEVRALLMSLIRSVKQ